MDGMRAADGQVRLLELISGAWSTQAIAAAVELGLPEQMKRGPIGVADLAVAAGCDADSLQRLLRALASLDLCRVDDADRYTLSATGRLLVAESEGSLHDWALWCGRQLWPLWGDLAESVRTGRSARERRTGLAGYAHLVSDEQAAAVFNLAMRQLTARVVDALANSVDWRSVRCVVDLGGGYGELLSGVLRRHPHLRGVLADLPHALAGARALLEEAGVASRCAVIEADFFQGVPEGGDLYALKSVLHNWDDAACGKVLRNCRRAMRPGARLLLVERVLAERIKAGPAARAVARSDLNMLVGVGGRERTLAQFAVLLEAAGFDRISRGADVLEFAVIEARAA